MSNLTSSLEKLIELKIESRRFVNVFSKMEKNGPVFRTFQGQWTGSSALSASAPVVGEPSTQQQ